MLHVSRRALLRLIHDVRGVHGDAVVWRGTLGLGIEVDFLGLRVVELLLIGVLVLSSVSTGG